MAEQQMHGFRARLDYMLKHNYVINRAFTWSASAFFKTLVFFLPIDNKLVVFISPGSLKGTSFTAGKTDLSVTASLATENM